MAATGPMPGIERSRPASSASAGWRAMCAAIALSNAARRRSSLASPARMSRTRQRVPGVAEAVLLLRDHALQLVAALAERAQLLPDGVAVRVRGRLALGPEAGEHARVDAIGLREVERAGEVPGVQRVQPHEVAAGRLEAGAHRPVAAARRLEHHEVVGTEAGGPAGDRLRLVERSASRRGRDRRRRAHPCRDRRRCGSVSCWYPVHVFGLQAHATVQAGQIGRWRPSPRDGFARPWGGHGLATGPQHTRNHQTGAVGRCPGSGPGRDGSAGALPS